MKHITGITALSMAIIAPAWAGYIAPNTTLCISERTLTTYVNNEASGQDAFNQDLLDRAACYEQLDGVEVALLNNRDNRVEVRLPTGHSAWAKASAYTAEKPAELEVTVVQTPAIGGGGDESVAEKSSWLDKIRSYWPF